MGIGTYICMDREACCTHIYGLEGGGKENLGACKIGKNIAFCGFKEPEHKATKEPEDDIS